MSVPYIRRNPATLVPLRRVARSTVEALTRGRAREILAQDMALPVSATRFRRSNGGARRGEAPATYFICNVCNYRGTICRLAADQLGGDWVAARKLIADVRREMSPVRW